MLDNDPFDVCFKKHAKNVGVKRLRSNIRRNMTRIKNKLKKYQNYNN